VPKKTEKQTIKKDDLELEELLPHLIKTINQLLEKMGQPYQTKFNVTVSARDKFDRIKTLLIAAE
jgi:hypothetical protein